MVWRGAFAVDESAHHGGTQRGTAGNHWMNRWGVLVVF